MLTRRALRAFWKASRRDGALCGAESKLALAVLAKALDLPSAWLADQTAAAAFFGALWADVLAHRAGHPSQPLVPARHAIDELRSRISAQLAEQSAFSMTSIR